MQKNISPWIEELNRDRTRLALRAHMTGEVAVIGGGIAGMTTAYYLLKKRINILH